jgi:PAS domain-containing protein
MQETIEGAETLQKREHRKGNFVALSRARARVLPIPPPPVTLATALVVIGLPAFAAGIAVGVRTGRLPLGGGLRRVGGADRGVPAESVRGGGDEPPGSTELQRLRSNALDVAADPLLIVGAGGEVLDCNTATFALLDRHRSAVIAAQASSLRTLWLNGASAEWDAVVAARAPWSGDALVRLPDGSHVQRAVRLVPLFGVGGEVRALVEAYRDPWQQRSGEHAVVSRYLDEMTSDASLPGDDDAGHDPAASAARELQRLALGVAALDRVLRQYERLVPAMRAEDPLTEVMAGLVAETRQVAESADVSRLLRELPRTVDRLRLQLQALGDGEGAHATARAASAPTPVR